MSGSSTSPSDRAGRRTLVAVDVGNQRVKLGCFHAASDDGLPEPAATLSVSGRPFDVDRVVQWLGQHAPWRASWWIGSVNRPIASRLLDMLRDRRPDDPVTLLAAADLPIAVALARPDMVGVDRLLDAVAANRLRRSDRPAVVVDVGTAITVDLVMADGAFRGGAILPGIAMSARAMHEFTDLLPMLDMADLRTPPLPAGTDTVAAMQSGLFWGAVGAIREMVARMQADGPVEPDLFLTGGASPAVAQLLGPTARHVPHLTLSGIALAAAALGRREGNHGDVSNGG
ncbi:MAG: type III pantothenate kinase [Pirellulales bacterium]|nr:type III pantothenate kinase [Pirellulales bacterium]